MSPHLWFLLPSICLAIVKLATELGELPVIPLFDYTGFTYPVDSPTGLSGRAVAALFNYDPGYMHCWIPEASATEAELNAFRFRKSYGELIFERWQVNMMRLPQGYRGAVSKDLEMRFLKFDPKLFNRLSPWSQIQNVHLIAKDSKSAREALRSSFSKHEAILRHFSVVERPLIERVKGFFDEVGSSLDINTISLNHALYYEMTKWALQEHDYFPTITTVNLGREEARLLLNHGLPWFHTTDRKSISRLNAVILDTFGNWQYRPTRYHYLEVVLLNDLKQPSRRTLNPNLIDRLVRDECADPCNLLAALHLRDTAPQLVPFLFKDYSLRSMSEHTRAYLRGQKPNLLASVLIRFGFYDIDDLSNVNGIMDILKNQPAYLAEADAAGLMRLAARIAPALQDPSQLLGAPWQVLLCLMQGNRMKK